MARHLSDELRRLIVSWRQGQGKTVRDIAALADCSECTVYTVLKYDREYGVVVNPSARQRGCRRTLEVTDIDFVLALIDANPSIYLDELQERLLEVRDLDVSLATLCRCNTGISAGLEYCVRRQTSIRDLSAEFQTRHQRSRAGDHWTDISKSTLR